MSQQQTSIVMYYKVGLNSLNWLTSCTKCHSAYCALIMKNTPTYLKSCTEILIHNIYCIHYDSYDNLLELNVPVYTRRPNQLLLWAIFGQPCTWGKVKGITKVIRETSPWEYKFQTVQLLNISAWSKTGGLTDRHTRDHPKVLKSLSLVGWFR